MGDWKNFVLGSDNYKVYEYDSITHDEPVLPLYLTFPRSKLLESTADLNLYADALNNYATTLRTTSITHQLYDRIPNGGIYDLENANSEVVARVKFTTATGLKMWYCTLNMVNPSLTTLNHKNYYRLDASDTDYEPYDTDYALGIKFRFIGVNNPANTSGTTDATLTLIRVGGRTENRSIYGGLYAIDEVHYDGVTPFNEMLYTSQGYTSMSLANMGLPSCSYNIALTSWTNQGSQNNIFTLIAVQRFMPLLLLNKVTDPVNNLCTGQLQEGEYADYTVYPYIDYYFTSSTGIDISDVVNTEPAPPEEDEYMNELNNRFSPRFYSNLIGIYPIPAKGTTSPEVSGIMDVSIDLMQTDMLDLLKKTFASGNEGIIGIKWFYGIKSEIESAQANELCDICVGGGALTHATDDPVSPDTIYSHTYPLMTEFVKWNTSKLRVDPHFNNYLDYLSSYKLYLPYYGFMDIDPNDIVGGTIQVFYNINVVTGAAVITIACKNSRTGNAETKYYSVSTTVGMEIPFGVDMVKSLGLQTAEIIGKSAKFALSATATGMSMQGTSMARRGNAIINHAEASGVTDTAKLDAARDMMAKGNTLSNVASGVNSVANNIPSMPPPPSPNRSNGVNNELGSLDELHPYLLISRPIKAYPDDYEDYMSLPSYASEFLSQVHGFTQIAAVKPETLTNAPKYINEIISLLQAGVYL